MPFNPNKITDPKAKTPPRPIRAVPIPERERVPPTPGQGRQEISPRLRLDPKNFKNDKVPREDSHYEKKIFEELRQHSYITEHPTSQSHQSTYEIRRVYDGFDRKDYTWKSRGRSEKKYDNA
eukprot:5452771-Amphidinium_carterae.1